MMAKTTLTPDNKIKRTLANKLFHWKTTTHDSGGARNQILVVSKDGCTGDGCYEYWEPLQCIKTAWEIVEHFQSRRDTERHAEWVNFSNALRGAMLYTMTEQEACRVICEAAIDTARLTNDHAN